MNNPLWDFTCVECGVVCQVAYNGYCGSCYREITKADVAEDCYGNIEED